MNPRALLTRLPAGWSRADGVRTRSEVGLAAAVVVLLAAVALGAVLRLDGLDWDAGHHLHPDERYLSIVANDIRGPSTVAQYFDVEGSPLSPYNVQSGQSYLYGELPLLATKLIASLAGRGEYGDLYLVGRHLSAIVDLGSVLLVFALGRLLFAPAGRRTAVLGALLASAFYALAVTAIQHAHFFTVDSWLVFSTLLAVVFAAYLAERREPFSRPAIRYGLVLATGAAVGAAVSAKLSGGIVVLPVALALTARALEAKGAVAGRLVAALAEALLVVAGAYVAFRLTSPYAFARDSWLDVRINDRFRSALEQQEAAVSGDFLYPPSYQWLLSHRILDPAENVLAWGLGPALGLAAIAGLAVLGLSLGRALTRRQWRADSAGFAVVVALMVLAYVLVSFVYFGTRFAHTLRYLLPIAPFLCLAAAAAVLSLRRYGVARPVVGGALLAATVMWALAFTTIYREPQTRVAASAWITETLPTGSTVVNEHWDDGLPVGGSPLYEFRELPVFDPDDAAKLRLLHERLAGADLYVLSSPRAWKTIGRLPRRFPLMARFYELLREEQLGWHLAARFESKPGLLGISVDDLGAEEAFWVYDHPPVELYRPRQPLNFEEFATLVCGDDHLPGCP